MNHRNRQRNLVALLFVLGLCARTVVFIGDHREGDEVIYMTLVEQLETGAGYTLQGSEALERGVIDKQIYDRPLFFHPPGGIGLFWLFHRAFGPLGFPLAQLFSFSLFYWSMIYLGHLAGMGSSRIGMVAIAGLSAFSPIMAHVTTNYWLDGPLLAFSTLATAIFLRSVVHDRMGWACCAGAVLGYASLIKVTAFLIVPGVVVLGWFFVKPHNLGAYARLCAGFIATAALVLAPWIAWHWIALGTPLTSSAGNPDANLLQTNRYVHFVTIVRSPWIYASVLPRVVWTLVPSLILLLLIRDDERSTNRASALVLWIAVVLVVHIVLGFVGYSKLLRYVILITPASILLFATVATAAVARARTSDRAAIRGPIAVAVATIAVAAFILEIATGLKTSLAFDLDLIVPILGGV